MIRRWLLTFAPLALGGVAALHGASLSGQSGPCATSTTELARAVTAAHTPTLTRAQQTLFAAAVGALRRGNSGEAGRQLGALVRANPALARNGGLCALIHATVRQGTDGGQVDALRLQTAAQAYQQAVTTIANIQQSMYDDAMKVIDNLKS